MPCKKIQNLLDSFSFYSSPFPQEHDIIDKVDMSEGYFPWNLKFHQHSRVFIPLNEIAQPIDN